MATNETAVSESDPHPNVGDLDLFYEAMQLPADQGLQFVGFTAEPGSQSDDALRLLGSLSASAAAGGP